MGQYSIKDLEKLSGIKAHTIRMWEKRHNLIIPERTDTNIRYYSDDDLKKILNVSILNSLGLKISKIVQLSPKQLCEKVLELTAKQNDVNTELDKLVLEMLELNEYQFEKLLSGYVLKFGFKNTMVNLIYPFLDKIGVLWQTGNINPAHEHFVSSLIRQKILVATDGLPIAHYSKENSFILFLNEGELHELGLLYYNYLIREAGFSTFYLGQSVPIQDLELVDRTKPSKYLITAFVSPQSKVSLQNYLNKLASSFPEKIILISGYQVIHHNIQSRDNLIAFKNVIDLQAFIESL